MQPTMNLRQAPLLLLLATLACGGDTAESGASDTPGPDAAAMQAATAGAMAPITEPIALSESDMERFVAVLGELKELGESVRPLREAGTDLGAGLAANAEAMAILRRHDFDDLRDFQQVGYSIASAIGAAELAGREDEMAAAREKMEAMKGSMPKAQYDAMMQAQGMATGMVSNQPDGNVALVQRWRDRLEAASASN
ncbi:MAG: hypothetical protein KC544_04665 [Gemmatimonadetes bacterium]|nr:hypothetical protein [Gemmatimonadota bacterium]